LAEITENWGVTFENRGIFRLFRGKIKKIGKRKKKGKFSDATKDPEEKCGKKQFIAHPSTVKN